MSFENFCHDEIFLVPELARNMVQEKDTHCMCCSVWCSVLQCVLQCVLHCVLPELARNMWLKKRTELTFENVHTLQHTATHCNTPQQEKDSVLSRKGQS